ncbi:unnamed protein product [Cyprideis torosa]|uniref:Uncharacterized protein n=1 Tax=Cyprideis torosa TaxID=163714 RepID=A0A7R8WC70_9CRUS|nr:unnamed protein product [Cyprideis torosa]CAG0893127.1 unnamed protein product [Cyprideis torosa]
MQEFSLTDVTGSNDVKVLNEAGEEMFVVVAGEGDFLTEELTGVAKLSDARQFIRHGDLDKLMDLVLQGKGSMLAGESASDPKVRSFLKTVPSHVGKIEELHRAVSTGDLRQVKSLLERRQYAISKDSRGVGLLHKAVVHNQPVVAKYLAENYPECLNVKDTPNVMDGTRCLSPSLVVCAPHSHPTCPCLLDRRHAVKFARLLTRLLSFFQGMSRKKLDVFLLRRHMVLQPEKEGPEMEIAATGGGDASSGQAGGGTEGTGSVDPGESGVTDPPGGGEGGDDNPEENGKEESNSAGGSDPPKNNGGGDEKKSEDVEEKKEEEEQASETEKEEGQNDEVEEKKEEGNEASNEAEKEEGQNDEVEEKKEEGNQASNANEAEKEEGQNDEVEEKKEEGNQASNEAEKEEGQENHVGEDERESAKEWDELNPDEEKEVLLAFKSALGHLQPEEDGDQEQDDDVDDSDREDVEENSDEHPTANENFSEKEDENIDKKEEHSEASLGECQVVEEQAKWTEESVGVSKEECQADSQEPPGEIQDEPKVPVDHGEAPYEIHVSKETVEGSVEAIKEGSPDLEQENATSASHYQEKVEDTQVSEEERLRAYELYELDEAAAVMNFLQLQGCLQPAKKENKTTEETADENSNDVAEAMNFLQLRGCLEPETKNTEAAADEHDEHDDRLKETEGAVFEQAAEETTDLGDTKEGVQDANHCDHLGRSAETLNLSTLFQGTVKETGAAKEVDLTDEESKAIESHLEPAEEIQVTDEEREGGVKAEEIVASEEDPKTMEGSVEIKEEEDVKIESQTPENAKVSEENSGAVEEAQATGGSLSAEESRETNDQNPDVNEQNAEITEENVEVSEEKRDTEKIIETPEDETKLLVEEKTENYTETLAGSAENGVSDQTTEGANVISMIPLPFRDPIVSDSKVEKNLKNKKKVDSVNSSGDAGYTSDAQGSLDDEKKGKHSPKDRESIRAMRARNRNSYPRPWLDNPKKSSTGKSERMTEDGVEGKRMQKIEKLRQQLHDLKGRKGELLQVFQTIPSVEGAEATFTFVHVSLPHLADGLSSKKHSKSSPPLREQQAISHHIDRYKKRIDEVKAFKIQSLPPPLQTPPKPIDAPVAKKSTLQTEENKKPLKKKVGFAGAQTIPVARPTTRHPRRIKTPRVRKPKRPPRETLLALEPEQDNAEKICHTLVNEIAERAVVEAFSKGIVQQVLEKAVEQAEGMRPLTPSFLTVTPPPDEPTSEQDNFADSSSSADGLLTVPNSEERVLTAQTRKSLVFIDNDDEGNIISPLTPPKIFSPPPQKEEELVHEVLSPLPPELDEKKFLTTLVEGDLECSTSSLVGHTEKVASAEQVDSAVSVEDTLSYPPVARSAKVAEAMRTPTASSTRSRPLTPVKSGSNEFKVVDGRTPLMWAAGIKSVEGGQMYEQLLNYGSNTTIQDNNGHIADDYHRNPSLFKSDLLVMEAGGESFVNGAISSSESGVSANGDARNTHGRSQSTGSFVVSRANIRKWIHRKDIRRLERVVWEGHGRRLLSETSSHSRVRRFFEAVPHLMNKIRDVHQATIENNEDMIDSLLNERPEVLASKDRNGNTPTHKAAGLGHVSILQKLLERAPLTISTVNQEGRTPLHFAALAKDKKTEVYDALVQAGADEKALDKLGRSAQRYMAKAKHMDVSDLTIIPDAPRTVMWSRNRKDSPPLEHLPVKTAKKRRKPRAVHAVDSEVTDEQNDSLEGSEATTHMSTEAQEDERKEEEEDEEMYFDDPVEGKEHEDESLGEPLIAGLSDVSEKRPEDPVEHLADYLHSYSRKNSTRHEQDQEEQEHHDSEELEMSGKTSPEKDGGSTERSRTSSKSEDPSPKRDEDAGISEEIRAASRASQPPSTKAEPDEDMKLRVGDADDEVEEPAPAQEQESSVDAPLNPDADAPGDDEEDGLETVQEEEEGEAEAEPAAEEAGDDADVEGAEEEVVAEEAGDDADIEGAEEEAAAEEAANDADVEGAGEEAVPEEAGDDADVEGAGEEAPPPTPLPTEGDAGESQPDPDAAGESEDPPENPETEPTAEGVDDDADVEKGDVESGPPVDEDDVQVESGLILEHDDNGDVEAIGDAGTESSGDDVPLDDYVEPQSEVIEQIITKTVRRPEKNSKYLGISNDGLPHLPPLMQHRPDTPLMRNFSATPTSEAYGMDKLMEHELMAALDMRGSQDKNGHTILHMEAKKQNSKLESLLESPINRELLPIRDLNYETARDIARTENRYQNVDCLDRVVVKEVAAGRRSFLMRLLMEGYDDLLEIKDPSSRKTLSEIAEANNQPKMVEFLAGIEPFIEQREHVLSMIRYGDEQEVIARVQGKELAMAKSRHGRTPLHVALLYEKIPVIEHLLRVEPKTATQGDNLGRSPLHYAMATSNLESIAKRLVSAGARKTKTDLMGRLPSYYFLNQDEILKLKEEEDRYVIGHHPRRGSSMY